MVAMRFLQLSFHVAYAKYYCNAIKERNMFGNFGKAIVDGMFKKSPSTDGLVRMFEVEYGNDYRAAKRSGVHIDRQFVMEFLKSAK